jgi:hypothetical protein
LARSSKRAGPGASPSGQPGGTGSCISLTFIPALQVRIRSLFPLLVSISMMYKYISTCSYVKRHTNIQVPWNAIGRPFAAPARCSSYYMKLAASSTLVCLWSPPGQESSCKRTGSSHHHNLSCLSFSLRRDSHMSANRDLDLAFRARKYSSSWSTALTAHHKSLHATMM